MLVLAADKEPAEATWSENVPGHSVVLSYGVKKALCLYPSLLSILYGWGDTNVPKSPSQVSQLFYLFNFVKTMENSKLQNRSAAHSMFMASCVNAMCHSMANRSNHGLQTPQECRVDLLRELCDQGRLIAGAAETWDFSIPHNIPWGLSRH